MGNGIESRRTKPIDSPSRDTTAWSATVPGLVRKKKPRVMWKRQSEVRIVRPDMSAMASVRLVSLREVKRGSSSAGGCVCVRGCGKRRETSVLAAWELKCRRQSGGGMSGHGVCSR